MVSNLTQEKIKEYLHYNRDTGVFTWVKCENPMYNKTIAGVINPSGYRYIQINSKKYLSSRLVFLYMEGYFPENEVDHINRIKSDDRWCNLREVTKSCNQKNRSNPKHNTSGVKGVSFINSRGRWVAKITSSGKIYHLGEYKEFDDAVCARLNGEQCLDWQNCDSSSPAYQYVQEMIKKED